MKVHPQMRTLTSCHCDVEEQEREVRLTSHDVTCYCITRRFYQGVSGNKFLKLFVTTMPVGNGMRPMGHNLQPKIMKLNGDEEDVETMWSR